jgi:protocatechuate 3,4-dioxygenase beta subunit
MANVSISRQEFLRRALAGSVALPLILNEACSGNSAQSPVSPTSSPGASSPVCTTTAAVPEGPFYKDEQLNRSDITDGKDGVRITYEFLVIDSRCQPVSGAIVDIWQADRNGVYSDFASQGSLGEKFLRGYQVTDGSGRCRFTSIFPGWYAGRLTHLHGKLRVNGITNPTTNFFFPKAIETDVYNSPLYSGRGQNNTSVAQDVELRGDVTRYNALMMQVAGNVTNGYVATFTLTGA